RHILGNSRPCSHRCTLAEGYGRHQSRIGTDKSAIANDRFVLIDTIIVTGDGARAYIDVGAQLRVTDIAEVVDLTALAHLGVLGFNGVTHFGGLSQNRARTDSGEGSYMSLWPNDRVLDDAMGQHFGARFDPAVADEAIGPNPDTGRNRHLALEHHVDVDLHVLPTGQGAAHVYASRVGQGGARRHQAVRFLALEPTLKFGQLQAIIDAHDFLFATGMHGSYRHLILHRHGNDVRQVILALRVAVGEFWQPALQQVRRDGHNAG